MLPIDHKIKTDLIEQIKWIMGQFSEIKDTVKELKTADSPYIERAKVETVEMDTGCVKVSIQIEGGYYYEMLSELTGMEIDGQYGLIKAMKELSGMKTEYDAVKDAFASVKMRGYGVVSPKKEDITLEEPVIILIARVLSATTDTRSTADAKSLTPSSRFLSLAVGITLS